MLFHQTWSVDTSLEDNVSHTKTKSMQYYIYIFFYILFQSGQKWFLIPAPIPFYVGSSTKLYEKHFSDTVDFHVTLLD